MTCYVCPWKDLLQQTKMQKKVNEAQICMFDTGPQNKLNLHSQSSSSQERIDNGNIQPGEDSKCAWGSTRGQLGWVFQAVLLLDNTTRHVEGPILWFLSYVTCSTRNGVTLLKCIGFERCSSAMESDARKYVTSPISCHTSILENRNKRLSKTDAEQF